MDNFDELNNELNNISNNELNNEEEDNIDFYNVQEIEEHYTDLKYSWEDLLEMLCGTQYYSDKEILYVYLVCNKLENEAKHVLEEIAKEIKQRNRKYLKKIKNKVHFAEEEKQEEEKKEDDIKDDIKYIE